MDLEFLPGWYLLKVSMFLAGELIYYTYSISRAVAYPEYPESKEIATRNPV